MNIYLLTQEDAFYIPKLLDIVFTELPTEINVVGVAVLSGEMSRKNTVSFFRFLGPKAFFQIVIRYIVHQIQDLFDPGGQGLHSVRGSLRKHNVRSDACANINDLSFQKLLAERKVDLVCSVACPQIVREDLLNLPKKGCINIHGALLPKYRGRMPSFWVLAKGEEKTGVTIHYMSKKVDDGPIIIQKEVPILREDTLHSLVLRSKVGYGARALVDALSQIERNEVTLTENNEEEATYYSFPTREAVREFKNRGRKFR